MWFRSWNHSSLNLLVGALEVVLVNICLLCCYSSGMMPHHKDLGIAYLSSYLKEQGHTVMLRYMNEKDIDLTETISFCPELIGMAVYDISKDISLQTAKKLKKLLPKVKICLGGYYSTYHSLDVMHEAPWVDYVVRGEGEIPITQLAQCLTDGSALSSVNSLVYRDNDSVRVNSWEHPVLDLNKTPMPDRSQMDTQTMGEIINISTSRGCTSNCSFCSSRSFWKGWRGKSADRIVSELESMAVPEKTYMVTFLDSSFEDPDYRCNRLKSIAEGIIQSGLSICYHANFKADFYKKCDEQLIALLKKSGLTSVFIGFEAGNEEDLSLYGKSAAVSDNIQCIEFFLQNDILVNSGFINFNPYSTIKRLKENIELLNQFGFASDIFLLTSRYSAFNCNRLYKKIDEDGLFTKSPPGEFDYEFHDNRIAGLLSFLNQRIEELNTHQFLLTHIKFFTFHHELKIKYLMAHNERILHKSSNLTNELQSFLNQNTKLRYIISQKVYCWFSELLELTQQSRFHQYQSVSEQLLPVADLQKLLAELQKERVKCIKTLISYDLSEYIPLLNVNY